MTSNRRSARFKRFVVAGLALAVLVPSLYGFGTKFLEFIALYRGDVDGVFAITPILNYLLASLGFLCLFGWAALGGMFHDVERPKQVMLDNEQQLDRDAPWRQKLAAATARRRPRAPRDASPPINRLRSFYDHD
jgi:hypothetical protein